MILQWLNLNFCCFHSHSFGQISLNVLQKCVQCRSSQSMKMHETIVRSNLVLDTMLFVDEHRFQQNHSIVMSFTQCPTITQRIVKRKFKNFNFIHASGLIKAINTIFRLRFPNVVQQSSQKMNNFLTLPDRCLLIRFLIFYIIYPAHRTVD